MKAEESIELLLRRWPAVVEVVRGYGAAPEDLWRQGVVVWVRINAVRPDAIRDAYVLRLDFADYDDHAPRVQLCDPHDVTMVGKGREFYPKIEGNSVFSSDNFFCMPGDRRCYEHGNHPEWMNKMHYHPDIVIGSLFEILRAPGYVGRA